MSLCATAVLKMLFTVTVPKFKWTNIIKIKNCNQKMVTILPKVRLHLKAHNFRTTWDICFLTRVFSRTVTVNPNTITMFWLSVKFWDTFIYIFMTWISKSILMQLFIDQKIVVFCWSKKDLIRIMWRQQNWKCIKTIFLIFLNIIFDL